MLTIGPNIDVSNIAFLGRGQKVKCLLKFKILHFAMLIILQKLTVNRELICDFKTVNGLKE